VSPTAAIDNDFGSRLRRERERRQISLSSIAANTKISTALLDGLERGDVSRWPHGIFRKSFVRDYAVAIGIDPEETVREFLERFPDPNEPFPAEPVAARPPAHAPGHTPDHTPAHPPVQLTAHVAAQPARDTSLRLTLADTSGTFRRGAFLTAVEQRCAAVACDLAVIAVIGLSLFAVLGVFWAPLAAAVLGYYAGGILLLGNTPGVCLFAPSTGTPAEAMGTGAATPTEKSVPSQRSTSGQKNVNSTLLPAGSA
jgi:transcriptional regulator with XRE-family HTH domain